MIILIYPMEQSFHEPNPNHHRKNLCHQTKGKYTMSIILIQMDRHRASEQKYLENI